MSAEAAGRSGLRAMLDTVAGLGIGFVAAAILVVLPIFAVAKINLFADPNWQEPAAGAICLCAWALSLAGIFSCEPARRRQILQCSLDIVGPVSDVDAYRKRSRLYRILSEHTWLFSLLFVFLFCESTALCIRLHMFSIEPIGSLMEQILRIIGVLTIIIAVGLQTVAVNRTFRAKASSDGEPKLPQILGVRHPLLLGWLIFFIGFPLAFGVWMPLVALPGCYVGLNWWVNQQEAAIAERLGESYFDMQKNTWKLFPIGRRG
jgi:protein-S-isoprenylcysteine O-methyltransferase Ste14